MMRTCCWKSIAESRKKKSKSNWPLRTVYS